MYHFTADHPPEPVRLSFRALIPGHIRQYLKDFQLEAIRFMHNFLAKEEFCVYNDESGLGKQAAVAVLLDAACSNRKCLIVVQNDDRYVNGWEFHFNVLTNNNVAVIKDEKDSTDSAHSIYIAKWSTLRTIDGLSKLKFDFIILDNRGQMLNNSFCTSMLLKHYERKINILISSVDITSDLKLLHNVLRLGGRLDPQFSSFKVFEEKFKLPDAKELAYKRVDLEEYFCKRERLADYCKAYRLRRYCHQFETQLPLVKEDRYKINLDLWREKQIATNSESSSIEYVNQQNREDEPIKDTQELFEEYCRQRRKQHLQFQQEEEKRLQQREQEMLQNLQTEKEVIYTVDDEVALINESPPIISEKPTAARDNSDEPVLMSPLMVESDSDPDDIPEICNDPNNSIEIVDLSSEERELEGIHNEQNEKFNAINKNSANTIKVSKKTKKRSELDKLDEDIVDSLKIIERSKRLTRHAKGEDNLKSCNKSLKGRLEGKKAEDMKAKKPQTNDKTPKSSNDTSKNITSCSSVSRNITEKPPKENIKTTRNKTKSNCLSPKTPKTTKDNKTLTPCLSSPSRNLNSVDKSSKTPQENKKTNKSSNTTTPLTSRKSKAVQSEEKTKPKTNNQFQIKQEILEKTPQTRKCNIKDLHSKVKTRLKRESEITPAGVHHKQTRSMQRLTRSAGGSKYLTKNLALQIDKISKPKKKSLKTTETIHNNKTKMLNENKTKQTDKIAVEAKTKQIFKNTQTSIISHRSSQDYESLQCAQRLSDAGVFDNAIEKNTKFLVPPTPNEITRNSLIPLSLTSSGGFFSEAEVIFIPPSNPNILITTHKKRDQVILLSSSDNENSTSQTSSTNVSMTSRRTRALKPKRNQQQTTAGEGNSKVPSFSELLAQHNTRTNVKSPDLFSNCSDLIPLPCTQPNLESEEPNTPFEGFKIFGSEVKQLQQHYALNQNNKHSNNFKKSFRDQRSCLDILEKMFEPSNKKQKQITNEKLSNAIPTKKPSRSTTNKQKPHTQILPSHPVEAIAEARQQQELQQKRKRSLATSSSSAGILQDEDIFEITNNGTFGSVMRLHSNGDISPLQHTQKPNSNKQHNKITNYLIGNATQVGSNGSQEEVTPNSGNSAANVFMEAGTPSKRHQQLATVQNSNVKKSPKGKCNLTQATKLTKWFTKPSELTNNHSPAVKEKSFSSKKSLTKQGQANQEQVDLVILTSPTPTALPATGKRVLKRRRLDLSFNK